MIFYSKRKPKITFIKQYNKQFIRKNFKYIVKEEYICFKKFKNIDINNSTFLKNPKDIYLCVEVSLALTKLSEKREKAFIIIAYNITLNFAIHS